jgi:putative ABC transport system permease protein
MQIPVVAGRAFQASDGPDSARVAIVNDTLARRYFGGNAVGRRVVDSSGTSMEIVGVVRATARLSLGEPPSPVVFYPLEQSFTSRLILVARTSGDPRAMLDTVRRRIIPVDRGVAVFRTTTLEAHVAEALAANRLTVALVTACGLIAFLLAVIGVYGVVAYALVRRTREIGVRVALGASPARIVGMLLREGGRVTGVGIAAGALAALAATRLLASMLFGVSATDPLTFILVPAAIVIVAFAASWIPAHRALRVDPILALRHE